MSNPPRRLALEVIDRTIGTGTDVTRVARLRDADTGDLFPADGGLPGGYLLKSPNGDTLATVTINVADDTYTAYAIVSGDAASAYVGQVCREEWTFAPLPGGDPGLYTFAVEVFVDSLDNLSCPISLDDALALYPSIFARYPTGQTSWGAQWAAARHAVIARIVAAGAVTAASLRGSALLRDFWFHTLVANMLRAVSGGAASLIALAQEHEAKAERAWPTRVLVDRDHDGKIDDVSATTADAASVSVMVR